MQHDIVVRRFTHQSVETDPALTNSLIECFQKVFADPPWGEWKKCSVCGQYWGTESAEALVAANFKHCGTPLVDYWPHEQVMSDLQNEITAESSAWVAICDDRVVGFCWGYPISTKDLEEKLKVPVAEIIEQMYGVDFVAYQDELGVLTELRGHGIAHKLVKKRLDDFLERKLKVGIVRTRLFPNPTVTYHWFTEKLDYKPVIQYPGADGRVILGQKLEAVRSLLSRN